MSTDALQTELFQTMMQTYLSECQKGGDVESLAKRLGMGPVRLQHLLAEEARFDTRDILRMMEHGLVPTPGCVTSRRGGRYTKPMVFVPRDEPVKVQRSTYGWDGGLDVLVEDLEGEKVTLKISRGVAQAIQDWMNEHD